MEVRKLAIFDIDGTVFRWSLFIDLVYQLVQDGVYPSNAAGEYEHEYMQWLNRKEHYNTYLTKVIKTHYRYLKGCHEVDAVASAKRVVAAKKDRVYRYTHNLIAQLKKENYYLLANSGSPSFIVEEYAKQKGFDKGIGAKYEVVDGIFTGKSIYGDSPIIDKSGQIKEFIKTLPFEVDLKEAVAVGDTISDIEILQMVGNPIVFNPDQLLLTKARENGWKIIVERKDVIYNLTTFDTVS
jgi:HAD superfamily hydrolase (TIGR01490 family)